jgi:hypothetical protein
VSQQELLTSVLGVLNAEGIPYMLTGSVASSIQGEPRFTHDVDIVVDLRPQTAKALVAAFPPPAYYLDEQSVTDAMVQRGEFNLLAVEEGDKVDFWLMTDEPFDQSRFGRRQAVDLLGTKAWISSPEDTLVMKLRWAQLSGGSEKQLTDALHVYEAQRDSLDLRYIRQWIAALSLAQYWDALSSRAAPR